ncbi:MAG: tetraspanin family protein, partial [Oscillospiraceae bacterium]|nr:tetraspanin family protein [Oscillospiraceae bacterium]
MKFKAFLICMAVIFLAEISAVIWFFGTADNGLQDSVEVNTAVQSVTSDWENIAAHKNVTGLDYTVLDRDGNVLFKTKQGLSESVNEAVINRDTI